MLSPFRPTIIDTGPCFLERTPLVAITIPLTNELERYKCATLAIEAYVIRKLLHPLAGIDRKVRKSILSDFWKSISRKYGYYGMAKLDDNRIAWIIKSKSQARLTNRDIADAANVSISRVQQLYRIYKRSNSIPKLKNLVEREKKSAKRKELLSGSYMVYTRLMHAISKRYFLLMVIASITIGFTECFSRRVWH
jgi:hypothetical protein